MNKIIAFLFLFGFSFGFSQINEFKNQDEQEDYWAKQVFEKERDLIEYQRYKSKTLVKSNNEIQFGNKTLIIDCSSKFLPIFTEGIFYPQLVIGNAENKKKINKVEFGKLNINEQVFYKINRNDLFNISELEELQFLSNDSEIKRFRFWSFHLGMANPQVYYFELTNESATKNTSLEDFIKNSKLTFVKSGHIIL